MKRVGVRDIHRTASHRQPAVARMRNFLRYQRIFGYRNCLVGCLADACISAENIYDPVVHHKAPLPPVLADAQLVVKNPVADVYDSAQDSELAHTGHFRISGNVITDNEVSADVDSTARNGACAFASLVAKPHRVGVGSGIEDAVEHGKDANTAKAATHIQRTPRADRAAREREGPVSSTGADPHIALTIYGSAGDSSDACASVEPDPEIIANSNHTVGQGQRALTVGFLAGIYVSVHADRSAGYIPGAPGAVESELQVPLVLRMRKRNTAAGHQKGRQANRIVADKQVVCTLYSTAFHSK